MKSHPVDISVLLCQSFRCYYANHPGRSVRHRPGITLSVRSIIEYNTKALYLQLHSRGNYSKSNGYEIHSVLITDGIFSSYAT